MRLADMGMGGALDDPEYHLKRNVRAARYPTTETSAWNELSDDAKFIVTHLLTASPAKRLSAWEALQHPWFKSRYHDPTSNRSTLSIAKQAMVRRRASLIKLISNAMKSHRRLLTAIMVITAILV